MQWELGENKQHCPGKMGQTPLNGKLLSRKFWSISRMNSLKNNEQKWVITISDSFYQTQTNERSMLLKWCICLRILLVCSAVIISHISENEVRLNFSKYCAQNRLHITKNLMKWTFRCKSLDNNVLWMTLIKI